MNKKIILVISVLLLCMAVSCGKRNTETAENPNQPLDVVSASEKNEISKASVKRNTETAENPNQSLNVVSASEKNEIPKASVQSYSDVYGNVIFKNGKNFLSIRPAVMYTENELRLDIYTPLSEEAGTYFAFLCRRANQDLILENGYYKGKLEAEEVAACVKEFEECGLYVFSAKSDQEIVLIGTIETMKKVFDQTKTSYGHSFWIVEPAERPDIWDFAEKNGFDDEHTYEAFYNWRNALSEEKKNELFATEWVTVKFNPENQ